MIVIWTIYSLITFYIMWKSRESPLKPTTPRHIYKWFHYSHALCYGLSVASYIWLLLDAMGFTFFLSQVTGVDFSSSQVLLFYGTYFAVLGRDCADLVTDTLANSLGVWFCSGSYGRLQRLMVCRL